MVAMPFSAHEFFAEIIDMKANRSGGLVYNYRYGPHNDVSVNGGPHIPQWSHKIIILRYYNTY